MYLYILTFISFMLYAALINGSMQNYNLAVYKGMLAETCVYTCFHVVFYSSQNIQKDE